jgi:hypothetical protein
MANIRKFLTSVADVTGYDTESGDIVFSGKTLLDSSVETTLGSTPIRGGRGSQLLYIYYHTAEMKFTLTDTQWNLAMLGATVGSDPSGAATEIYTEENVHVTGGAGAVTGTPIAVLSGDPIYGWATSPLGVTEKVVFTGSNFSVADAQATGYWCVRYIQESTNSTSIVIHSNIIPKVVRLVLETQLNSADVTTNKIGVVQIIAPTVTLSGAFKIDMKSDGVSNTPLTASALAYSDTGSTTPCSSTPYYAKIVEIIDDSSWYDNVIGLAIAGGDFPLVVGATGILPVYAIPNQGAAFRVPDYNDLDFTSSNTGAVTIGLHTGLYQGITGTGATGILRVVGTTGTSIINVEAECIVSTKTS